jgi:hypothetical protein
VEKVSGRLKCDDGPMNENEVGESDLQEKFQKTLIRGACALNGMLLN